MRVAVVNFQRSGHNAFLPTMGSPAWNESLVCGGLHHCFNDDFSVIHRPAGSRANEVIAILIVMFTHANIGPARSVLVIATASA